jgi:hypothetical protein
VRYLDQADRLFLVEKKDMKFVQDFLPSVIHHLSKINELSWRYSAGAAQLLLPLFYPKSGY